MSSDDEVASGQEDFRALLDFVHSGSSRALVTSTPPPLRVDVRSLSPASREKYFELEAQKEVAGYFASSSFQNSPSPDDLPAPLFAWSPLLFLDLDSSKALRCVYTSQ